MDAQSGPDNSVVAHGGLSGAETVWVWDALREEFGRVSLAELEDGFAPGRFMVLSLNPFSARVEFREVGACRRHDGQAPLVEIGTGSGRIVRMAVSHKVLTISDNGHITAILPSCVRRGLMPRYLETGPGTPVSPVHSAAVMKEVEVDIEADTDYEWLRCLTTETWGWDRLEDAPRITPERLEQLRIEVVRRANRLRLDRLQKMDCHDCLVKIAGHMARGCNLLDALCRLERVWPVFLKVSDPYPGAGPVYTLEVGENENFLTTAGFFVHDGSVRE